MSSSPEPTTASQRDGGCLPAWGIADIPAHLRLASAMSGDDVRKVYYSVLLVFTAFGMWAIFQSSPGGLILLGASIAVFNFMVMGTHVLVVHRKFLPKELRMPLWRELAIGLFILMFAAFLVLGLRSQWSSIAGAFGFGR